MKIYTGFGDEGSTALLGGKKVDKNHPRVNLYGTFDELNSFIGLLNTHNLPSSINENLSKIQHDIFSISSEAASLPEDEKKLKIALVAKPHIQFLEKKIDEMTLELPKLKSFILPGGLQISALAHVCRTITRRAERLLIGIDETLKMRKEISVYINRLSDYFFTLARYLNYQNNVEDVQWKQ